MTNTYDTNTLPAAWGDAEQLDGLDLVDKATLIGVPFRITSLYFSKNERNINYVWIDGETADGDKFTFNDSSSTGVKKQVIEYLELKDADTYKGVTETNDVIVVNLVIPRGLRVSEYPNPNEPRKMAKTYYLSTSGKRADA